MANISIREDFLSHDLEEKAAHRRSVAKLFDTKIFSDVTFIVKGVKFHAHKNILSTRYEYFELMFGNWKEAKQNEIEMHDIEPEVFNIVLSYIYKARITSVEHLKKHAVDLIRAANLYGIHGLRKMCEKYLIYYGKINIETACEYFILADDYNASQLKAIASKFISMHLEEVKKTSGYTKLKRHRTSTTDLFEMISPKRPKLYK